MHKSVMKSFIHITHRIFFLAFSLPHSYLLPFFFASLLTSVPPFFLPSPSLCITISFFTLHTSTSPHLSLFLHLLYFPLLPSLHPLSTPPPPPTSLSYAPPTHSESYDPLKNTTVVSRWTSGLESSSLSGSMASPTSGP